MIRVSALRNRPVVCDNKQTGFLQSLVFDAQQRRVDALIVARGIRGKCTVPASAVMAITHEFILVGETRKYDRNDERMGARFIRDTNGLLIGRVADHAMDEEMLSIEAVEMMRGYLGQERRGRIWLFSYAVCDNGRSELTVPVIQGFESIHQKEDSTCVFQP